MKKIRNPEVAEIFKAYPKNMRSKLMLLRELVFDTALETEGVGELEETVKWGEPSYVVKGGSTIRMHWKSTNPDQYAMYFHCRTKLVDTFKEIYRDKFKYDGNRAIIFNENDKISVEELKHCIALSLTYHARKHLPMLGV